MAVKPLRYGCDMETISHWINGALSNEKSDRTGDVYNPATGQICAKVKTEIEIKNIRKNGV